MYEAVIFCHFYFLSASLLHVFKKETRKNNYNCIINIVKYKQVVCIDDEFFILGLQP